MINLYSIRLAIAYKHLKMVKLYLNQVKLHTIFITFFSSAVVLSMIHKIKRYQRNQNATQKRLPIKTQYRISDIKIMLHLKCRVLIEDRFCVPFWCETALYVVIFRRQIRKEEKYLHKSCQDNLNVWD